MSLDTVLSLVFLIPFIVGIGSYFTILSFFFLALWGLVPAAEGLGFHLFVLVVAVFFLIEFFIDKIPWLDIVWEVAHLAIRPLLALFILQSYFAHYLSFVKFLIFTFAALSALLGSLTRLSIRATLDSRPAAWKNWVAAAAEMSLVMASLYLLVRFRWVSVVTGILLIAGSYFVVKNYARNIPGMMMRLKRLFARETIVALSPRPPETKDQDDSGEDVSQS